MTLILKGIAIVCYIINQKTDYFKLERSKKLLCEALRNGGLYE